MFILIVIMYILALTSDISSVMAAAIHGDGAIVAEKIEKLSQYYGCEEVEAEDARDSFTSILSKSKEEYKEHEISIKNIYQASLKSGDFSTLEEIAEREKGKLRSPVAKAFLSHILLSGLISEADEFEGRRHSRRCRKFFNELDENKRSGVSLFLKGTLHEHTARKIIKEERRRKVLDDAFDAYQEAASKFYEDDEAQLRLGDWYRTTYPTKAKKWYTKVVTQNKEGTRERAESCLRELDLEELLRISSPLSPTTTEEDVSPIPNTGTTQKKGHRRITASSSNVQGIF